jgi:hypothetical protein
MQDMRQEPLIELVADLTPEEQATVGEFTRFLRGQKPVREGTPFLAAVEDFITTHPELLRRLAQ